MGVAITALVGTLATQTEVGEALTCQVGGTVAHAAGGAKPSCGGSDDPTSAQPISNTTEGQGVGDQPPVPVDGDQSADDTGDRRDQERDARGDRRGDARGDRGDGDESPDGDTDGSATPDSGLGTPTPGTSTPTASEPPAWSVPDEGAGEHSSEGAGIFDRAKEFAAEMAANAMSGMWPAAARNLLHYLDNSGETLEQDVDDMLDSSDTFSDAVDVQRERLITEAVDRAKAQGADGPLTFPVNTPWTGVYIGDDKNWFYALGGISFNQNGSVTVTPPATPGGAWTYSWTTEVNIRDRYNWDGGKSTDIGPFNITDEELAELHRKGLAQEFTAVGSSDEQQHAGEVS